MIEKKSLKAWGANYQISPHFKLKEMASKDGADLVYYSSELITKLEELRSYLGGTIAIVSGYRTPSHNKKVRGAVGSQHTKGTAADISVKVNGKNVSGKLICCLCQTLGFRGIGYMSETSTHVDMRSNGLYRGDERKNYGNNVNGDFYAYFGIAKEQINALRYAPPSPTPEPTPAPVPKKETKKEDDEEMIYKTVADVPKWGRDVVQLYIDHGWTDGKNLPESLVRGWVAQFREDPYIANRDNAPVWARPEIDRLIAAGKLKGNGAEKVGMRLSTLRAIICATREV